MTSVYNADTGVFVRCGGPERDKFQRLRRAVRQAGISLRIPQRVYEKLGGDPTADQYPLEIPYADGFEEGWITVAEELDYANPLVSTLMDEARRFIANETDRNVDIIEKADTALIGLAAQLLDTGQTDRVELLTTDKPAGRAAEVLLPQHGFRDSVEYWYVTVEYLETLTTNEFR